MALWSITSDLSFSFESFNSSGKQSTFESVCWIPDKNINDFAHFMKGESWREGKVLGPEIRNYHKGKGNHLLWRLQIKSTDLTLPSSFQYLSFCVVRDYPLPVGGFGQITGIYLPILPVMSRKYIISLKKHHVVILVSKHQPIVQGFTISRLYEITPYW